ncbi:MAG: ECF transporter S component [Lachnospiraceae bacterium]|nr:ECF transporter S component [Lachnospiraceae bacterium]
MKKTLTILLLAVLIPAIVVIGAVVFRERFYAWIALAVAVLSVLPLLYAFERRDSTAKELMVLAVMIALSVIGRVVFAAVPGFKPVTAITVIVAVAFGGEAGFTVGSLSAVVSNFYFGQGPWTPFQMFSWGIIGLLAGLLRRLLKKHIAILCIYGALAGIAYSLTMDVWTVLWSEGAFVPKEYAAAVIAALPLTAVYAVSNVVFLLLLAGPVGKKLERLKKKDGLFLSE